MLASALVATGAVPQHHKSIAGARIEMLSVANGGVLVGTNPCLGIRLNLSVAVARIPPTVHQDAISA
jgi:hypothetical protein